MKKLLLILLLLPSLAFAEDYFGYQTVGSATLSAGQNESYGNCGSIYQHTAIGSQIIDTIYFYAIGVNASPYGHIGVYTVSDSLPDSLVFEDSITVLGALGDTAQWYAIPCHITLYNGVTYTLAVTGSDVDRQTINYYADTLVNDSNVSADNSGTLLPTTWSHGSYVNKKLSLYAAYSTHTYFGDTVTATTFSTMDSSRSYSNILESYEYIANGTETVDTIAARFRSLQSDDSVAVGIYTVTDSIPVTLIYEDTIILTGGATLTWYKIPVSIPLTAGTKYTLAIGNFSIYSGASEIDYCYNNTSPIVAPMSVDSIGHPLPSTWTSYTITGGTSLISAYAHFTTTTASPSKKGRIILIQ